jgi:hypothetical protein
LSSSAIANAAATDRIATPYAGTAADILSYDAQQGLLLHEFAILMRCLAILMRTL